MEAYDVNRMKIELKKIFKGYRIMTKWLRKQLKKLGLVVVEGSKHYKLVTLGNHYVCTIAKTSSDFRSGYNIVHNICYGISNNVNKVSLA